MAGRKRPGRQQATVTHFPPLPRVPPSPGVPPDPRQANTAHVLSAIADVAKSGMKLSGANLSSGFHASAVDVGRLQVALERGLARFDQAQVESRWNEIFDWIRRVLQTWVQRCKKMRIERCETGIRIEIETQDDLGYYSYGFDVFPQRQRRAR